MLHDEQLDDTRLRRLSGTQICCFTPTVLTTIRNDKHEIVIVLIVTTEQLCD